MKVMYSDSVEPAPFEYLPQGDDLVDIPEDGRSQALHLSQSIGDSHSHWQTYLALLALAGFTEWMEVYTEAAGLILNCDCHQARVLVPSQSGQSAAVSQIKLNQHFRICLIATTGTIDEIIELPQAIVERSKQLAHFYINVMVDAESGVAAVRGFLRHDQLKNYCQQQQLFPTNGSYIIPIAQFESRIDRFLLLAHSLNPQAIPLPENDLAVSLTSIKQLLIQPAINTRKWLQRQLDEQNISQQLDQLSQTLGNLLALPDDFNPELIPAFNEMQGFRSSASLDASDPLQSLIIEAIQALQQQGYDIPVDVRVRVNYQNLCLDEQPLRLTFVIWELPGDLPTGEPEWSLLVIAQLLSPPTEPLRITIQQPQAILATAQLDSPDHYQVLQAIGYLDEQFTIELSNAESTIVLPAFKFAI